ncbi:leucine-rich repeat protein [Bacilliculturomica massiliensis]|uniref:leucine-rich repeat protein n=1 Tax=Bacilliculturomica massiliensis TaxID=1917867 RepID=UPI001031665A|nr:leucine-rich repeat protein [Bacilliculturomica massiliensis]
MKNRTHKRSLSLLLCAALLLGQLSSAAYAETTPSGAGGPRGHRRPHTTECGYMVAEGQPCGFVCQIYSGEKEDARPAPGPIALADVRRMGAENVPSNAQGVQDVVLEVTFNDNGDGDEMETAIETALAALPPGDKMTVTAIELTGSAVEITGQNWRYLLERFHRDSGWDSLTALDLSPMANLKTMRNDTIIQVGNITKLQTLTLPDGLTQIGQYAFYHCSNLDLQALPSGLTQIGESAFSNCPNLALQALPEGLTQIDGYAFSNCTSLALQALPEGLKQIGESAFSNCRGLALQALPNGLTQIEESAFSGCENLALQALPEGLKQIGEYAFSGCENLALQALPNGLTQIGGSAFSGCENLALQALPEGLKQIGEYAFSGCENLALQALPEGLKQIGEYAFSGCENLALQALPNGLTQIGGSAFSGCTSLDRIIMESTTAPAIASSTFEDTSSGLTFYVPKNGKGYDSGGWEELLTVEYDLTLDLNTLQLKTGQSQKLTATLRPTGAVPVVSWESSDTGVVTVDGSGSVTAVSTGTAITAIITATARQGGETASCTVTVNPSAPSGGGGHSSSGGGRQRRRRAFELRGRPFPHRDHGPAAAPAGQPCAGRDRNARHGERRRRCGNGGRRRHVGGHYQGPERRRAKGP